MAVRTCSWQASQPMPSMPSSIRWDPVVGGAIPDDNMPPVPNLPMQQPTNTSERRYDRARTRVTTASGSSATPLDTDTDNTRQQRRLTSAATPAATLAQLRAMLTQTEAILAKNGAMIAPTSLPATRPSLCIRRQAMQATALTRTRTPQQTRSLATTHVRISVLHGPRIELNPAQPT
jgi:hypothetical protein